MRTAHLAITLILLASPLGTGTAQVAAPNPALFQAIHDADLTKLDDLLKSGANPNGRNESGETALMHAAAFAPETARRLLAAGAEPNVASASGATALMWATHDASTVRLLLDSGADVNTARRDGATALISAALRSNAPVVRMLLAAGADARTGHVPAPWPMTWPQIVLTTNDPAIASFLDGSDATPEKFGQWPRSPLSNLLLTSVFSWRPQPASSLAHVAKVLIDGGASPNETLAQLTLTLPALAGMARLRDVEAMRVLLERGADPNARGPQGVTPLMVAAATDPKPAMVQLLLAHGAEIAPQDAGGRSAMDWARTLGETEAAGALRAAGAVERADRPSAPPPVASPRPLGLAVDTALARLLPAGPAFYNKTKCISCHNQSLASVAASYAMAKGVVVDRALASHPTQATLETWAPHRDNLLFGHCSIFGFLGNVTYGLFGLAEEGVAPNQTTGAVASCLAGLQRPDGSWMGGDVRPPLADKNPIVYTALALKALKVYALPGHRARAAARISRALDYLRGASASDTQEETFRLLGLVWGGAGAGDIDDQVRRLLALQRQDGGWSHLPTLPSDPYATGQVLHALYASGHAVSSESYRRGADYLRRTQLEDGTWYMRSRAFGFQPYVDAGFPHGRDQFISAAATAWAVVALSHAL